MEQEYQQIAEENGVCLARFSSKGGHWSAYYVVCDTACKHYRLTFGARPGSGFFSVGIGAEWSDDRPGELANFTPSDEHASGELALDDDVAITDSGLLTVMARRRGASTVDIRAGFVARLPREFVGMVRQALDLVRDEAKPTGEQA